MAESDDPVLEIRVTGDWSDFDQQARDRENRSQSTGLTIRNAGTFGGESGRIGGPQVGGLLEGPDVSRAQAAMGRLANALDRQAQNIERFGYSPSIQGPSSGWRIGDGGPHGWGYLPTNQFGPKWSDFAAQVQTGVPFQSLFWRSENSSRQNWDRGAFFTDRVGASSYNNPDQYNIHAGGARLSKYVMAAQNPLVIESNAEILHEWANYHPDAEIRRQIAAVSSDFGLARGVSFPFAERIQRKAAQALGFDAIVDLSSNQDVRFFGATRPRVFPPNPAAGTAMIPWGFQAATYAAQTHYAYEHTGGEGYLAGPWDFSPGRIVASRMGQVMGDIALNPPEDDKHYYLESVRLHKEYRGMGFEKQLTKEALKWIASQKMRAHAVYGTGMDSILEELEDEGYRTNRQSPYLPSRQPADYTGDEDFYDIDPVPFPRGPNKHRAYRMRKRNAIIPYDDTGGSSDSSADVAAAAGVGAYMGTRTAAEESSGRPFAIVRQEPPLARYTAVGPSRVNVGEEVAPRRYRGLPGFDFEGSTPVYEGEVAGGGGGR